MDLFFFWKTKIQRFSWTQQKSCFCGLLISTNEHNTPHVRWGRGLTGGVLGIILWTLKRDLFYQPLFPRSRMNCHTLFFYFNCPWCSKVTVRFTLMCAWIASCPVTPKQLIYFFVSPHCVYFAYIALSKCLSSVFHNVAHHITYSLCSEWLIVGCLL